MVELVELEEYRQVSIEKILEDFVSANKRDWYPWVWPEKEWWEKQERDKLGEDVKLIKRARELANTDLFFFADEIMRYIEHPHLHIGLHDELCHIVQSGEDVVILVARNHLKSTIVSEAYPIWLLGKNPNMKILIISDTLDVAEKFLSDIKQNILRNVKLKYIFPNLKPMPSSIGKNKEELWNKYEIMVQRDIVDGLPSISAMSILQTKTGLHYDKQIYDDIVTVKNAETDALVKKIIDRYEMSLSLMDRHGGKIMIGTPYDDGDVYTHIEEKGIIPFHKRYAIENGKYSWNEKYSIERVRKMERELPAGVFASQYMLDPISKETQEFKEEWMREWDYELIRNKFVDNPSDDDFELHKSWIAGHNRFLGMDPNRAQIKIKRNDSCIIMAVGMDVFDNIFVYDYYIGKPTSSLEITQLYCNWFERWNPVKAKLEAFGGDSHLVAPIKEELKKRNLPYFRVSTFDVTRWKNPEDKVREIQTYFEKGQVFVPVGIKGAELKHELLRFPKGKHDDIITTLALIITQMAFKPKVQVEKKQTYNGWRRNITNNNRPKNWLQV